MTPIDESARRRARWQFALVALAFLGTPLLATRLYAFGDKGHHGDTVNRYVLVDPARPVDGAAGLGLLDAWTLVVIARDGCAAGCERTLVTLRQVRLTFGPEAHRVARVLVSGAAADATRFAERRVGKAGEPGHDAAEQGFRPARADQGEIGTPSAAMLRVDDRVKEESDEIGKVVGVNNARRGCG